MTDQSSIEGSIENGRRGLAQFPFYSGPVGIRQREGSIEVAFFSPPLRLRSLPVGGKLDGQTVEVIGFRARDFNAEVPAKPNDLTPRVIVAVVVPMLEGE